MTLILPDISLNLLFCMRLLICIVRLIDKSRQNPLDFRSLIQHLNTTGGIMLLIRFSAYYSDIHMII